MTKIFQEAESPTIRLGIGRKPVAEGVSRNGPEHLLRYRDDGDDFVQHIVAEDKTWCHHFQLSACNSNIPNHIGPKNSKLSIQSERL
ncbi:hypothetical protein TNCV_2572252 [Trichonephila clavipes]|nr:hypothetical protein TNCV_2572252 [Trichonephila clavipes]